MAAVYKRPSRTGKGYTWRVTVTLPGKKRICKSFPRKELAASWAEETRYKVKHGHYEFQLLKQNYTFKDLVDRYVDDGLLEHYRSKRDTLRHLKYFCDRFGAYSLSTITSELISQERKLLTSSPHDRGESKANATVNRYMSTLSAVFSYAYSNLAWIPHNPCKRLKKLKEAGGRNRTLSQQELPLLLKEALASSSPYLYCIILMALVTGARQGEILGLTWDNLDLDRGLAHIPETKNGCARTLPLAPGLIEELQKLYATRDASKPLVFASKTAFGSYCMNKSWRTVLKKADIKDFRFHDMRHHFATAMARKGASTIEIQTALGHKTLQMVEKYTHLKAESSRPFSNDIAADIFNILRGYDHGKA
jgi:integrase